MGTNCSSYQKVDSLSEKQEKDMKAAAMYGDCAYFRNQFITLPKKGQEPNLTCHQLNSPLDERARTALHIAVDYNQPDVVYLLLDLGADPQIRDLEDKTPYDIALRRSPQSVRLLEPDST